MKKIPLFLSHPEQNPKIWIRVTFLWMVVIFILSTPFFSSELTRKIAAPFNIRLAGHIFVYFCLGFLASGAVDMNFSWKKKFLIPFVFCVFYAFSDELHQHFEPHRNGRGIDFLTDIVSAFVGISVYFGIYRHLVFSKKD